MFKKPVTWEDSAQASSSRWSRKPIYTTFQERRHSEVAMGAVRRKLVWVAKPNFEGWACSECAWTFNPSEMPSGKSIGEMKQNYERQRDEQFQTHACGEHLRTPRDPR